MTLARKVSDELQFNEVLASKHARYVNGVVVAKGSVAGDFSPQGTVLGRISKVGHADLAKYGPVTRGAVASSNTTANTVTLDTVADLFNFQVGDKVELINTAGAIITGEGDREITAINTTTKVITLNAHTTNTDIALIQKNDGTAKAELVCLNLIDVTDEDDLVGGIVHGAVYKARIPNYDDIVAADLPGIAFEDFAIQGAQA